MAAILYIDGLGKRYGLLPSEILNRSNTFDLYVMDCAISFENYQTKKANNNGKDPIPDYTTEELQAMISKVKKQ